MVMRVSLADDEVAYDLRGSREEDSEAEHGVPRKDYEKAKPRALFHVRVGVTSYSAFAVLSRELHE